MVADSKFTIHSRNNSADRLQALTPLGSAAPLLAGLESAKPRSCLAVRQARPHIAKAGERTLLACTVCSGCAGATTCTPLIVGGEVIGSVLADHVHPYDEHETRAIPRSSHPSRPVVGNLRNLALAERSAATDGLTCLPNKHWVHDTLRRIVAHSSHTSQRCPPSCAT
jgi:hypothetical protein